MNEEPSQAAVLILANGKRAVVTGIAPADVAHCIAFFDPRRRYCAAYILQPNQQTIEESKL